MLSKQKKFILQENDIPTQWYNIQADMVNKPLPPLNPKTKQPVTAEDLSHIFSLECSKQELDTEHRWIDIPEAVLDKYKYYRSTPLVRAYALEKALDTPAHIYFKNESVNPLGSHKLNSALAQCYYCKQEGTTNVTTETGAGQWGAALSYAAKTFGLEAAVYQVKISMQQKPTAVVSCAPSEPPWKARHRCQHEPERTSSRAIHTIREASEQPSLRPSNWLLPRLTASTRSARCLTMWRYIKLLSAWKQRNKWRWRASIPTL